MKKWVALFIAAAAGYVWLALWADERNQRFYEKTEVRNWQG